MKCNLAIETQEVVVDKKGGMFLFTKAFLCLGSNVDFLIDDIMDIKNRISKASKAIGALIFVQDTVEVLITIKIRLCEAIPMNLILQGSKNWSNN